MLSSATKFANTELNHSQALDQLSLGYCVPGWTGSASEQLVSARPLWAYNLKRLDLLSQISVFTITHSFN